MQIVKGWHVPAYEWGSVRCLPQEPELGWTQVNSHPLEVWRGDAYSPTYHGAVGFLVYERAPAQTKDFRLYYSMTGIECTGVPIEIAAEFTPKSRAAASIVKPFVRGWREASLHPGGCAVCVSWAKESTERWRIQCSV